MTEKKEVFDSEREVWKPLAWRRSRRLKVTCVCLKISLVDTAQKKKSGQHRTL